jgi:hypothetical protein
MSNPLGGGQLRRRTGSQSAGRACPECVQLPAAPSLFALDPNFRNPYVAHWNFGIQRDLGFSTVWEISYAGSAGKKMYEFRNANQALPTADPDADVDPRRPRPFLGNDLTYWCSCGSSSYHSLQTKVEKRFSNNLSFLTAYTFGKSIDEQSQASLGFNNSTSVRSEYNYRQEKGRSDYDQSHRFVVSYTYDLPFGRTLKGAAKIVGDGWQFVGIHAFTTGTRYDSRPDRRQRGRDARPDAIPGSPHAAWRQSGSSGSTRRRSQPAGRPVWQRWPQHAVRPWNITVDLSIFKNFAVSNEQKSSFERVLQPDQPPELRGTQHDLRRLESGRANHRGHFAAGPVRLEIPVLSRARRCAVHGGSRPSGLKLIL